MHPRAHAPHCCVLPRCRSSLSELSFFVSFPLFILILPPESPGRTVFSPQAAASSLVSRYVYFCFSCADFRRLQSTCEHHSEYRYVPWFEVSGMPQVYAAAAHSVFEQTQPLHYEQRCTLRFRVLPYRAASVLYLPLRFLSLRQAP